MDEIPSRHTKPHIGRRLLGRQAAVTRSSGLRLGRAVAGRHERPEPVRAAMRLVPKPAGVARAAAPPAAAPAGDAWVPSTTESTIVPGISDWASEWLFGDTGTAVAMGTPFAGGADFTPRTPEQKRLSRIKRACLPSRRRPTGAILAASPAPCSVCGASFIDQVSAGSVGA